MPKLLDPDCTFDAVLQSDKTKPNPPAFVFRALSVRRFNAIVDAYERIDNIESESGKMDVIINGLKSGLVEMKNMDKRTVEDLDDILTISEAVELLEYMLAGQQIGGDDAKN
jgi:hypothetical protein